MKEWLRETHGPNCELLRHFLLRFFDSDLVTAYGQTAAALIGAISIFLPWFPFVTGPLKEKYGHLSALSAPGPYRLAIRADELWLITLMMSAIGLLTAIKWSSLFPNLADYRSIGSLPVRARQIFGAKLLSLLIVATAAVIVLNLLPVLGFPVITASRWAIQPSIGGRLVAIAAACVSGCYFFFFALVAIQGVLLNLRITRSLQGLLAGGMLILIVMSFSIQPQVTARLLRPEFARWIPPVWFLGLCQTMMGDADPSMHLLAQRAVVGLLSAVGLVLAVYTLSYRRHRALMMEGVRRSRKDRKWYGAIFDWMVPNPHQQAVVVFLWKGLADSGQHRMILMGYGGFGLAILLSGMIGMLGLVEPARVPVARFVYGHVILLTFLLMGMRHLFSIPTELRANWLFQITEREGRGQWMRAVDRFVLSLGAAAMLLVPLPLEVWLLGRRAVSESVLFSAVGLLCYEWLFSSWEKLPFTCSYLPGKKPMWIIGLQLLGLLTLLPAVNAILLACLYNWVLFAGMMLVLLATGIRVRAIRRDGWRELRLRYEEAPDPAIHGLNLLK